MATNIPQDDFQKTGLRLPRDLHNSLHEAAAESGRSYNAEIVHRLQASFEAEHSGGEAGWAARNIERSEALMGELLALAEQLRIGYANRPASEQPPSEPLPQTQKEFREAKIDRTKKAGRNPAT